MNKNIIIGIVVLLIIGGVVVLGKTNKPQTMTASNDVVQTNDIQADTTMEEPEEQFEFTGEKGEEIKLIDGKAAIDNKDFETNKVKFFNTTLDSGKTVYYLILKDNEGNFRVAANANEKCAKYGKGYKQVGNEIQCLTCQKSYPLSDFAVAQPDCNPKPITTKATIANNQIVIESNELAKVSNLF